MISLLRILPAFLFATCLFKEALSTPIRSKNVDFRTESLRPSIQPRQQDWGKVASEIRDDTALIDLLNDIGICDEPPQLLGVNTFANVMLQKGYTSQVPFVFYTSGMGRLAEEWAPKFFQDPNRKAPLREWKYAIWDRISSKLPFSLFERMIRLKSAVQTKLQDSDHRSILSFWTSDIAQKNEVQAIAETIKGDAYLVIPSEQNPSNDVNGWDPDTAWGGT
ncbi:hypothetical protein NUU61_005213 [Penicillium alfredii]|uniref:Uncharacterized protein n=1 Tax=Penicillium alfredii TaxID=1506179 RepID=A0A9W9F9F5_9EURO|nr:uncharacterized protein NUU61_005213 [Penicillium alfredii]KAJ5095857.1 hypothetical protein NUU61_005213 [Penicillium alfredii]